MNTVKQRWNDYRIVCIPKVVPAIQIDESRKAFYAGAAAMFGLMTNEIATESEDAGVMMIDGLHEEIKAFGEESV